MVRLSVLIRVCRVEHLSYQPLIFRSAELLHFRSAEKIYHCFVSV